MARTNDWQRYQNLRDLIYKAVEEAEEATPDEGRGDVVTLAIAPDLGEVYATFAPWWDDDRLAALEGWHVETAPADDPAAVAAYYFDLR